MAYGYKPGADRVQENVENGEALALDVSHSQGREGRPNGMAVLPIAHLSCRQSGTTNGRRDQKMTGVMYTFQLLPWSLAEDAGLLL